MSVAVVDWEGYGIVPPVEWGEGDIVKGRGWESGEGE